MPLVWLPRNGGRRFPRARRGGYCRARTTYGAFTSARPRFSDDNHAGAHSHSRAGSRAHIRVPAGAPGSRASRIGHPC